MIGDRPVGRHRSDPDEARPRGSMLDHARRGRPHCHGVVTRPASRRRRPSPSDASPSAEPPTRRPTRRRSLLARALDVARRRRARRGAARRPARVCSPGPSGARRAAVLADGLERRAAVAVAPDEDPRPAEALAAWLDATADALARRARRRRPAPSVVGRRRPIRRRPRRWPRDGASSVRRGRCRVGDRRRDATPGSRCRARPGTSSSASSSTAPAEPPGSRSACRRRSPATPAVALALVTAQLAAERELRRCCGRATPSGPTFMSTVAHELRTPLTGLRGYLELILDGRVDDPDVERDFLRAQPGDRRLDGRARRRPARAVAARVRDARARDRAVLRRRGRAAQVAAALLPIAIERDIRLDDRLPAAAPVGDRRPPPRRADPDEPRRRTP